MQRRRRAQDRARRIPFYFIALSLALHVIAFLVLPQINLPQPDLFEQETIVEIDPALIQEIEKEAQRYVVMSEKANNTNPPEETDKLGERNQSVEKETKAKKVDIFQPGAQRSAPKLSLKNLAPEKPLSKPLERGDTDLSRPLVPREPQEQQRGGMEAATNDYLKDVKEGDRTLLNTREFVYFGYYHRIRQRLEQSWNTKLRNVLMAYYRSGRHLATDKNYITRLVVVLDRFGKIRAVKVLEESGARDLDDAAVEAFNRAGPFPNPPKGLIEKDGMIKIRWDFILQSSLLFVAKRQLV